MYMCKEKKESMDKYMIFRLSWLNYVHGNKFLYVSEKYQVETTSIEIHYFTIIIESKSNHPFLTFLCCSSFCKIIENSLWILCMNSYTHTPGKVLMFFHNSISIFVQVIWYHV